MMGNEKRNVSDALGRCSKKRIQRDVSQLSDSEKQQRIEDLLNADIYKSARRWENRFFVFGCLLGIATGYVELRVFEIRDQFTVGVYWLLLPCLILTIPLTLFAKTYLKRYFHFELESWWKVALVFNGSDARKETIFDLANGLISMIFAWFATALITILILQ